MLSSSCSTSGASFSERTGKSDGRTAGTVGLKYEMSGLESVTTVSGLSVRVTFRVSVGGSANGGDSSTICGLLGNSGALVSGSTSGVTSSGNSNTTTCEGDADGNRWSSAATSDGSVFVPVSRLEMVITTLLASLRASASVSEASRISSEVRSFRTGSVEAEGVVVVIWDGGVGNMGMMGAVVGPGITGNVIGVDVVAGAVVVVATGAVVVVA